MKKIVTTIIILLAIISLHTTSVKADDYIGDIKMVGYSFEPRNWAFCDGRLLPIQQYTALFSLLGTQYGGDGVTTFALPDLRGRVPVGQGQGPGLSPVVIGDESGSETTTLLAANLPSFVSISTVTGSASGKLMASTDAATTSVATGAVIASPTSNGTPVKAFKKIAGPIDVTNATQLASNNMVAMTDSTVLVDLSKITVTTRFNGSNIPISNMQPYLGVNYVICLYGIFPSRN